MMSVPFAGPYSGALAFYAAACGCAGVACCAGTTTLSNAMKRMPMENVMAFFMD
jgi:hypothetical protein